MVGVAESLSCHRGREFEVSPRGQSVCCVARARIVTACYRSSSEVLPASTVGSMVERVEVLPRGRGHSGSQFEVEVLRAQQFPRPARPYSHEPSTHSANSYPEHGSASGAQYASSSHGLPSGGNSSPHGTVSTSPVSEVSESVAPSGPLSHPAARQNAITIQLKYFAKSIPCRLPPPTLWFPGVVR